MDDKITIIEGPPPIFEAVNDGWAMGLNEGPHFSIPLLTRLRTFNGPSLVERCYRAWHSRADIHLLTRLRTFNGPSLVERCYRAWHSRADIHLHYRNELGLEQAAPIIAARNVESPDGHVLLLWVCLDSDKVKLEFDSGEDDSAEDGLA